MRKEKSQNQRTRTLWGEGSSSNNSWICVNFPLGTRVCETVAERFIQAGRTKETPNAWNLAVNEDALHACLLLDRDRDRIMEQPSTVRQAQLGLMGKRVTEQQSSNDAE